jgi:hypothetical protein
MAGKKKRGKTAHGVEFRGARSCLGLSPQAANQEGGRFVAGAGGFSWELQAKLCLDLGSDQQPEFIVVVSIASTVGTVQPAALPL